MEMKSDVIKCLLFFQKNDAFIFIITMYFCAKIYVDVITLSGNLDGQGAQSATTKPWGR